MCFYLLDGVPRNKRWVRPTVMGSLDDHTENDRAVGSARRQARAVEGGLPHVR